MTGGIVDEFEAWVADHPEALAEEQYLSTLPAEAREPDDDFPWDAYLAEDLPRIEIEMARSILAEMAPGTDPVKQIDRIHALQQLWNACARALAAEQVAFADTQLARQRAAGVAARNLGRGIAEQSPARGRCPHGYARRLAPGAAARQLGLSRVLTDRLPASLTLLRDGQVSEAQCQLLATKSSHLEQTDAAIVDAALAPRLTGWNLKQTEQAVQHAVYAIDPREGSWTAEPRRSRTARCGSDRHRTAWPPSPRCCPSPKASPCTPP